MSEGTAPWGARGARPVIADARFRAIPGAAPHPAGARLPLDVAVAYGLVSVPAPSDALPPTLSPDFADRLRPYQRDAVRFFAQRTWGVLALPMRTGKTPTAIAMTLAAGGRHNLVVTTGSGRWVWQDELERWTGRPPLVFEGRSAGYARRRCAVCHGDGGACTACRALNGQSYGYHVFEARPMSLAVTRPPTVTSATPRPAPEPGPTLRIDLRERERAIGPRLPTETELARTPARYTCSLHPDLRALDPRTPCPRCTAALEAEVRASEWCVLNYEIVVGQDRVTDTGADRGVRQDLPGYAEYLARLGPWDVVVLDEGQALGGRSTGNRRGRAIRERTRVLCSTAARVYVTTGTLGEKVASFWGPLDIASNGLFGSMYDFDARYAGGHRDPQYGGWVNDGKTEFAKTELAARLSWCTYRRERAEILPQLPVKQQVVHRIEAPPNGYDKIRLEMGVRPSHEDIAKSSRATLNYKLERLTDGVLDELREGLCAYVLCYLKESCETVFNALVSAATRDPALRGKVRAWLAHGEAVSSTERRHELARDFRDRAKTGQPGLWVATHDAMAGSISMRGALATHVVELHPKVVKLRQAVERPFEPGVTGFTEVFYLVRNSIDYRMLFTTEQKLEAQHEVLGDGDAGRMRAALNSSEPDPEEMWTRLTRHLDAED